MTFDHVIHAARDLETVAAHVSAQLDLPVAGGGEHEGQGTHNKVLPFGGGYVEVLALVDPVAPAPSPFAELLAARLETHGDGPFAWAVHVPDVAAVAARLGTALSTIARDGFSAHLTAVGEALEEPWLPFFIERDPGIPAPYPDGPGPAHLSLSGDAGQLLAWLGDLPDYVDVTPGTDGVVGVTIGSRELR